MPDLNFGDESEVAQAFGLNPSTVSAVAGAVPVTTARTPVAVSVTGAPEVVDRRVVPWYHSRSTLHGLGVVLASKDPTAR